jgi:hypothetical protein
MIKSYAATDSDSDSDSPEYMGSSNGITFPVFPGTLHKDATVNKPSLI